jgi:hypothetical protein
MVLRLKSYILRGQCVISIKKKEKGAILNCSKENVGVINKRNLNMPGFSLLNQQ